MHQQPLVGGSTDQLLEPTRELLGHSRHIVAQPAASFDGQRRFIANASHELRTPLTLNRTLLEVALQQESASAEVRQLGTTLLAINDRHGRLIDGLLTLARSERELTERSYVDLADIASHVCAADVQAELSEAATAGDPVLLERLVQNLVDNGVRHNLPDGGSIIDSPGVRDYAPPRIPPREVVRGFVEMIEPALECRFADCLHRDEPGCGVKAAVASARMSPRRYESYLRLLRLMESLEPSW